MSVLQGTNRFAGATAEGAADQVSAVLRAGCTVAADCGAGSDGVAVHQQDGHDGAASEAVEGAGHVHPVAVAGLVLSIDAVMTGRLTACHDRE